jgi:hypothetical protein
MRSVFSTISPPLFVMRLARDLREKWASERNMSAEIGCFHRRLRPDSLIERTGKSVEANREISLEIRDRTRQLDY